MDPYTRTRNGLSKALAAAFPGQEFKLKTTRGTQTHRGSHHINASISWTDGPTVEDVERVVDTHFYQRLNEWGSMWITSREVSSYAIESMLNEFHIVKSHDGRIVDLQRGCITFRNPDNERAFWRMVSQRSFYGRKLAATNLAGDYEAILANRDF